MSVLWNNGAVEMEIFSCVWMTSDFDLLAGLCLRLAWPVRVWAAGASGGGGAADPWFLRGADRSAGGEGGAGLREGGEEHVHLGAHRRAEQTERTSRAAEEKEEDKGHRRRSDIQPLACARNRKDANHSLSSPHTNTSP